MVFGKMRNLVKPVGFQEKKPDYSAFRGFGSPCSMTAGAKKICTIKISGKSVDYKQAQLSKEKIALQITERKFGWFPPRTSRWLT